MRGEIPERADVVSERSKIRSLGVRILDGAKLSLGDVRLQLLDADVEEKNVPDQQHPACPLCQHDKLLSFARCQAHRLLAEHILPLLEGLLAELVMGGRRRSDADSVNVRVLQHILIIC